MTTPYQRHLIDQRRAFMVDGNGTVPRKNASPNHPKPRREEQPGKFQQKRLAWLLEADNKRPTWKLVKQYYARKLHKGMCGHPAERRFCRKASGMTDPEDMPLEKALGFKDARDTTWPRADAEASSWSQMARRAAAAFVKAGQPRDAAAFFIQWVNEEFTSGRVPQGLADLMDEFEELVAAKNTEV